MVNGFPHAGEQLDEGDIVRCCPQDVLRGVPTEMFVLREQPALRVDPCSKTEQSID